MKRAILATLLLASVSVPVMAQDSSWFVSGAVGRSDFKVDRGDFNPLTVTSLDKKDTQYGLGVGYNFSRNLGVELGYLDFGKGKGSFASSSLAGTGDFKARSTQVSVLLSAPIDQDWQVFGRLGAARTDRKASARVGTVSVSDSEKKNEALFGVGVGYSFNKNLMGTLEFQKLNDTDVSAINLGVRISF
jgi:OOP family OmpA-OmpF porin